MYVYVYAQNRCKGYQDAVGEAGEEDCRRCGREQERVLIPRSSTPHPFSSW